MVRGGHVLNVFDPDFHLELRFLNTFDRSRRQCLCEVESDEKAPGVRTRWVRRTINPFSLNDAARLATHTTSRLISAREVGTGARHGHYSQVRLNRGLKHIEVEMRQSSRFRDFSVTVRKAMHSSTLQEHCVPTILIVRPRSRGRSKWISRLRAEGIA